MMPSLANSAGWNWIGPTSMARNAPFTCEPTTGSLGITRSAIDAAAIV